MTGISVNRTNHHLLKKKLAHANAITQSDESIKSVTTRIMFIAVKDLLISVIHPHLPKASVHLPPFLFFFNISDSRINQSSGNYLPVPNRLAC